MQKCVEMFGVDKRGKDPTILKMYKESGSDIWMARTLPEALLDYAAKDIYLIAKLYPQFRASGWLSKRLKPRISDYSKNYLEVRSTAGREVKEDNPFRQNALMLQAVLYRCSKCLQLLPVFKEVCFHTKISTKCGLMRRSFCRRRVVLARKNNIHHSLWDGWVDAEKVAAKSSADTQLQSFLAVLVMHRKCRKIL